MPMPRRLISAVSSVAVAVIVTVGVAAPPADAASKPRVFANCTALHQVYPHGVGKVGAHDKGKNKNFRPVTTFKRDNALYQANRTLDRDHDGVACEKR